MTLIRNLWKLVARARKPDSPTPYFSAWDKEVEIVDDLIYEER